MKQKGVLSIARIKAKARDVRPSPHSLTPYSHLSAYSIVASAKAKAQRMQIAGEVQVQAARTRLTAEVEVAAVHARPRHFNTTLGDITCPRRLNTMRTHGTSHHY
jgi:hypothetical protein